MSTISVDDVYVDETNTTAIFTVRLDIADAALVTVNYSTFQNTAANSSDFVPTSGSLAFAPGELSKTVSVSIINNAVAEGTESFYLGLSAPSANATIADAFALATITDNDAPSGTPVVSINDFVVDEASKEATFVITLDRPSTSVVSMNYATQNGTAVAGADFVAKTGSLSFAPGETAKTVKVTVNNDAAFENSEAFNLALSALTNATTLDNIGTATIFENDAAPVSNSKISVDDVFVDESQTYADYVVRLDAPNTGTVTVNYSTFQNTAANSSDFVPTNASLMFAPGELVKTVRVSLVGGAVAETTESFYLGLSAPSANATIADAFALATITDNDAPSGTPVVSINDFVVDEASKEATFVITLDRPSTSVVSMNYATQNGTAVAGADFVAKTGSLSFAPGETAKTVKVTVNNDAAFENSEAFNLALSALTNATTLDNIGTATIFENDAAPVSNSKISVDDVFVDESQTYADYVVRLDAPNTGTVTVNYSTFQNTAANSSDFVPTNASLMFAPGELVKTVRVSLVGGAVAETTESFYLGLSAPSANATIADAFALATITDNDAPSGTPVVSINDFVVDEASKEATFVITLDRPSTSVVSMNYATQNGTAVAGADFVAKTGSLSFAPGETAKTVKVTVNNDAAFENSEAFNLALSALTNATTLDNIGTATIFENDAAPVSNSKIFVDDVFVDESQTYADYVVRLDAPNTGTVTVNYSTFQNTAANSSDFVPTNASLMFAPGELVKTVRVSLVGGAVAETTESFYLGLSAPSANATIADAFALATITDNDAPSGTPVVSINDFVVDEASKETTFVITLNRPSTSVVSMNYATQNGTAVAGADFVAKTGSLSFAPGETAKTVKVTVNNDAAFENSEAFNLALSALTNATTLDNIGTATIFENDAAPVSNSKISVDDVFVDESQTYADYVVRLDAPNTGTVTVNYSTFQNTAANSSDFVPTNASLMFAPGEMVKTVRVSLVGGAVAETTESFYLGLSAPSANATIADAFALATITDNDAPSGTPVVSINDFVVDEASKEATFVITLDRPSTSVVSMNYATQNGTAVAGADFVAKTGSLSFAPGETAKTVKVTVNNDAAFENSEAFNLALSALTNATTLDNIGTATIFENDAAPVSNSKISVDDVFVDESQTYADYVVRLDAPNAGTVTVNYSTFQGTAANSSDFVPTNASLMFAPGEMVKTVRVSLVGGAVAETTESFYLGLSAPSANATLADAVAVATIIDNDAPTGIPVARITDAVIDETDQTTTVTVILNKPSISGVTFDVAGQNVTAGNNSDFSNLQIGRIAFAPGETAKTVTFGLLNDIRVEEAELFDAVLTNPVGATLGDARAHVVIAASDNAAVASPVLNITNAAVSEDKGYVDFLVTLTAPSIGGARVNYSTAAGTAANSSDFLPTSGTVVFTAGEVARVIRIILNDDITVEALENFTLNLSAAVNATIGTATATATIIDNESAAPVAPIAIAGTPGNDILQGTQFADAMTGTAGNDTFNGGEGNDSMGGGGGNDIYLVENAGDTYTEGAGGGNDLVISYLATHTLGANVERLQLAGTATTGIGNTLNNMVTGNARNNTLNGGSGNDTLDGIAGSDSISGGTGTDFFVFSTALNAATNVDIVTDFNVVDDTIQLENAIFTQFVATGAIPAGTFVSGASAIALDSNDFLIYNTVNGNLSYDADGNGAGAQVVFATLTGIPALTAADFVVI